MVFDDAGADVDAGSPLLPVLLEWLEYLGSRKSPNTVRGYLSDVGVFGTVLTEVAGKQLPPPVDLEALSAPAGVSPRTYAAAVRGVSALVLGDLHPRQCARALDRLAVAAGGREASSQRRAASAWSSLCRFAVRRGWLAANPMDHDAVERPKREQSLPKSLDYSESERMLQTLVELDRRARDPWPMRDLALAAVLLSTGIRVAEACSVPLAGIRARGENPVLQVRGKGGKDRVLPLAESTLEVLDVYLAERVERLGASDPAAPLFVRGDGSRFTDRALRRLVERWYARSGTHRPPGSCVHALRHTFATTALHEGTATVVELQAMLGHASLATTQIYLHVVGSGLQDAARAHPMVRVLDRVRAPA